ncbi:hypothetical protein [Burkholderia cenocepacia]|uniref:hypothetical protein n=1 Tax=Burkholderia cenocepacia TaxID=95486 RepID=UPI00097C420A|nr:hypothetical protein [Burkholderia cenocepacia]AQQ20261.1 hypothetical protein A8D61_18200 [Burkholderia cenocepacia]ONJ20015.1 hypothetical protein A8D82_14135 [Burkholderia cenocepacia]ONN96078.1 hypothetical protein A8D64_00505 [Burkholderia cenocepacia]ONO00527.1 hypothetical protein A8D62_00220 [Burkholderia cenocepacia]ONO10607.1 hypothetical protein A8D70_21045 [Burkholderia cenocepacia]
MKKLVALAIACAALSAHAEPVYVLTKKCVGDKIKLADEYEVLYPKRACKLPIVNQKDLRHFEQNIGSEKFYGCWGLALGNKVVLIGSEGDQNTELADIFTKADASPDGTAIVTKSPFTGTIAEKAERLCH